MINAKELARQLDNEIRYSLELSIKSTLEKHPLEHLTIGTEKDILNYSFDDLNSSQIIEATFMPK